MRTSHFRTLVLTGLLASAGIGSAFAQATAAAPAATAPSADPRAPGGRFDPARREARMQKHFADMKAKLRITPQQEGAWTTFTTAMQPADRGGAARGSGMQREDMAKLTTPQRLDKMREMRTLHQAHADRRDEAVKTFYAALTPAQQQTFDALPPPRMGRHGPDHGHGGPMGDGPAGKPGMEKRLPAAER